MNLLNSILLATGFALGVAVLVLLVMRAGTRRSWSKASGLCAAHLKELYGRFNADSEKMMRVDPIGREHLCWTLDRLTAILVDLESAKRSGSLEELMSVVLNFRSGLNYYEGYSSAMDLLASGRLTKLQGLEDDARRELHEAADRISRLGWTLGGSSVVRSAMQEMAGALRENGSSTAPLEGLQSVVDALVKANRTLFAAMVEADTSK